MEDTPIILDIPKLSESPASILSSCSPTSSPPSPTFIPSTLEFAAYAVSSEIGYKNVQHQRVPIHTIIEDVHYPLQQSDNSPTIHTTPSGLTIPSFFQILADGHGGSSASAFFKNKLIQRIPQFLDTFIASHDGHKILKLAQNKELQREFSENVIEIFQVLDKEYVALKTDEYRQWTSRGCHPNTRPVDDGCTLIVNIIIGTCFVNLNVGDSRTVVFQRSGADCSLIFESKDHNMSHLEKIEEIWRRGGQFINPNGTIRQIRQNAVDMKGTRIYRPLSENIKSVGVSHKRTLNLTGTMGDLLFKVEPWILSCKPDITFLDLGADLKPESDEFALERSDSGIELQIPKPTFNGVPSGSDILILTASDGLWDHLKPNITSEVIVNFIIEEVYSCPIGSLQERLSAVTEKLVQREVSGPEKTNTGLFMEKMCRYDDATAAILVLKKE
ncbi:hypothetical protein HK098_002066 [Nowakowskiella sp. JEL0407]|nr:hypothetical protein HK098_002066 [Nowakowskiella sp. JEL0407]